MNGSQKLAFCANYLGAILCKSIIILMKTEYAMIKNKTVSTRITSEKAKENLAKQGLKVSEYMQFF
jgi:hypothetical protein